MSINFLAKLAKSNPKVLEKHAQAMLLKEYGSGFYSLPLGERASLREKTIQQLKTEWYNAPTTTTAITVPAGVDVTTSKAFTETQDKEFAPVPANSLQDIETRSEKSKETFSLSIQLNAKQTLAAEFAENGQSFVLTGAAGTGKTTGCREIARRLLEHGKLRTHDFKVRGGGRHYGPSIAFCAYTNRAAMNMQRALHKDPFLEDELSHNVLTVHSLLEYEPVFFVREDGTNGMKFEPQRTHMNPLQITHLVIEESSMLGIDLWYKLLAALQPGVQIIFVGDINQLPPVFSKSILNYALVNLPVVELDEVYRQALDSPIIANAHRCLRGEKLIEQRPHFRIVQSKEIKKIPSETKCVNALVNSLKKWYAEKDPQGNRLYDPEQDMILSPYNKGDAGTIALNNHIAQFLGQDRNAMVYEVIAGMRKVYLAVGDRVMVEKQDGVIQKISHNAQYVGRMALPASTELTRFGVRLLGSSKMHEDEDLEFALEGYGNLDVSQIPDADDKERKQQSSHFVDVLLDSGRTVSLTSAGDFGDNVFSLGYALTVHKAQGCEWRKVIILLHRNHATLLNRELIYTAMTRAKEYLILIDLCNVLERGIANQRIKGNTVQEKIEWFNSEVSLAEPVPVLP